MIDIIIKKLFIVIVDYSIKNYITIKVIWVSMARPTVVYDRKVLQNLLKGGRAYVVSNIELRVMLDRARCGHITAKGQIKMDEEKEITYNGE